MKRHLSEIPGGTRTRCGRDMPAHRVVTYKTYQTTRRARKDPALWCRLCLAYIEADAWRPPRRRARI